MTELELQKEINKRFNERFRSLESWIKSVDERLDNHLEHMTSRIANIETDIKWIKKIFWLIVSVFTVSFISFLIDRILNG